jgi:hypothetical protein
VIDGGKKKNVITSKYEIKIRLQGIDAPELHFPVIANWDSEKGGLGTVFESFTETFSPPLPFDHSKIRNVL